MNVFFLSSFFPGLFSSFFSVLFLQSAQGHTPVSPLPTPPSVELILDKFSAQVKGLGEYSVLHIQQERFKDGLGPQMKMAVKYSKGRFYLKMLEGPKAGAEVLYDPHWNGGKVKVHKGKFPDITVNLDPRGSRMLELQHHPIDHLSFLHIAQSLTKTIGKCRNLPGSSSRLVKVDTGNPTQADQPISIEFIAPWHTTHTKVKKDANIWDLAHSLSVDPFLFLHTNGLAFDDDLVEDAVLEVPHCYAPRTLLTVDAQTLLPRKLEAYNSQQQLYESYEWQNLDTRPQFKEIDFDPDNPNYHF